VLVLLHWLDPGNDSFTGFRFDDCKVSGQFQAHIIRNPSCEKSHPSESEIPFYISIVNLVPTEWNYFVVNCSITWSESMEDLKAPK